MATILPGGDGYTLKFVGDLLEGAELKGTGPNGEIIFDITVNANTTREEREGYVSFRYFPTVMFGDDYIEYKLPVYQEVYKPKISVTSSKLTYSYGGEVIKITVHADKGLKWQIGPSGYLSPEYTTGTGTREVFFMVDYSKYNLIAKIPQTVSVKYIDYPDVDAATITIDYNEHRLFGFYFDPYPKFLYSYSQIIGFEPTMFITPTPGVSYKWWLPNESGEQWTWIKPTDFDYNTLNYPEFLSFSIGSNQYTNSSRLISIPFVILGSDGSIHTSYYETVQLNIP